MSHPHNQTVTNGLAILREIRLRLEISQFPAALTMPGLRQSDLEKLRDEMVTTLSRYCRTCGFDIPKELTES